MNSNILVWALRINGEARIIKDDIDKTNDAFTAILVGLVADATGRLADFLLERGKKEL